MFRGSFKKKYAYVGFVYISAKRLEKCHHYLPLKKDAAYLLFIKA